MPFKWFGRGGASEHRPNAVVPNTGQLVGGVMLSGSATLRAADRRCFAYAPPGLRAKKSGRGNQDNLKITSGGVYVADGVSSTREAGTVSRTSIDAFSEYMEGHSATQRSPRQVAALAHEAAAYADDQLRTQALGSTTLKAFLATNNPYLWIDFQAGDTTTLLIRNRRALWRSPAQKVFADVAAGYKLYDPQDTQRPPGLRELVGNTLQGKGRHDPAKLPPEWVPFADDLVDQVREVRLKPGDWLVFYTDGLDGGSQGYMDLQPRPSLDPQLIADETLRYDSPAAAAQALIDFPDRLAEADPLFIPAIDDIAVIVGQVH